MNVDGFIVDTFIVYTVGDEGTNARGGISHGQERAQHQLVLNF